MPVRRFQPPWCSLAEHFAPLPTLMAWAVEIETDLQRAKRKK